MTSKQISSGASSVPSSLPGGFQFGGLCCLVPSGLCELFPLAAQCQNEVRQAMTMKPTAPDVDESLVWERFLKAFRIKGEHWMLNDLADHLHQLSGIPVYPSYYVDGKHPADLVFMNGYPAIACGIFEVKTDTFKDTAWPEMQRAQYAALRDNRCGMTGKWLPAVCLSKALEIRIGIVVPAGAGFSGRTHFYVDVLEPTNLLRTPHQGLALMKVLFKWVKGPATQLVASVLANASYCASVGSSLW